FNGGDVQFLTATGVAPDASHPLVGACFGPTKRYRFYLNSQVTDQSPNAALHQHHHALVSDSPTGCAASDHTPSVQDTAVLSDSNARELIGEHMRLSNLTLRGG